MAKKKMTAEERKAEIIARLRAKRKAGVKKAQAGAGKKTTTKKAAPKKSGYGAKSAAGAIKKRQKMLKDI